VLAEPGHAPIAATAAVVPPAVLLGATHGVALLVRTRTVGATYWCALAMTAALAGCAFVLCFDSLYALAADWAGYRRGVAWLWPLSIDLSIAVSTLALLALCGAPLRAAVAHNGASVRTSALLHALDTPVADWTVAADELIGAGVTRIERTKVATVLAELADGTAPSTVARKVGVGYAACSCEVAARARRVVRDSRLRRGCVERLLIVVVRIQALALTSQRPPHRHLPRFECFAGRRRGFVAHLYAAADSDSDSVSPAAPLGLDLSARRRTVTLA
jgi:hypothetical protein